MVGTGFRSSRAHLGGDRSKYSSRASLFVTAAVAGLATVGLAPSVALAACNPTSLGVITCDPGTYGGIYFPSSAGLTLILPAGSTITSGGFGSTGSGNILVIADPTDSITSSSPNTVSLLGITSIGNVTLSGGTLIGKNASPTIDASTGNGTISITAVSASASGSAGGSIAVYATGSGPGGISANVTNVSAAGPSPAVFITGNGGVDSFTGNLVQATGTAGGSLAIDLMNSNGDVVINSGTATSLEPNATIFGHAVGGNVTITSGSVNSQGIGIAAQSVGGNVSIGSTNVVAAGNSTSLAVGIVGMASGDVSINSGSVSTSGPLVFSPDGNHGASSPIAAASLNGNVTIISASSTSTGELAGGIYAQANNGSATINSGAVSTSGPAASGVFAWTGGDLTVVSQTIATTGGAHAELATYNGVGGPAPSKLIPGGTYGANGIFALSDSGNISISSGSISVTGNLANAIVANAGGADRVTINGNVSSAQSTAIDLASGQTSSVTVQSGASVDGVVGIDATGVAAGLASANTGGVTGGLNVVDAGTITGTGGTAIRFNPGVNTLTLQTGAIINGAVVGAGPSNTVVLLGSLATPTASQTLGAYQNFQTLDVKTGYWTLPQSASYPTATVESGAALEIDNGLSGNLTDLGEVVFNTPGNYSFAGTFDGTGQLVKDGSGVLTFAGAYNFSGSTLINAGSIDIAHLVGNATLNVTGGTVNISSDATIANLSGTGGTVSVSPGDTVTVASGNFTGNISGGGSLAKTGNGTLVLGGNDSLGGNVTVAGGTLQVDGNLSASPIVVDAGATLGGSGLVNGNVTIGGTISPGDPVTTTVIGSVTFAPGSSYFAQVTAAGDHDLIAVTGPVIIKPGAAVEVDPLGLATDYKRLNQYTIITATGGVTGTFSTVTSDAPLLTPHLTYDANDVLLSLTRNDITFASLAATPNQAAVASAAEAGGFGTPLYQALVVQTTLGVRTGYDSLSGEIFASVPTLVLAQSDQARRSLIGRMDQPADKHGLWAEAVGDWGRFDGSAGVGGAQDNRGGLTIGVDGDMGGWRLGVAGLYGHDNISVASRMSRATDDAAGVAVYAGRNDGPIALRLGGSFAWHRLDTNRGEIFPGFSDHTHANFNATTGQVFGEVAYNWTMAAAAFGPFAGVSYEEIGTRSLAETGGASALSVEGRTRGVVSTRLGLRGTDELAPGVALHGSFAWRHASGDTAGAARLTFEGTGQSFAVAGLPIAPDSAELTAGLSAKLGGRGSLDLSYQGEVAQRWQEHSVKLQANWTF
jgi:fibronectin-binding autotransporter adhesin